MSIDLRDEGVTSVLLHPGWVRTSMTGGAPLYPRPMYQLESSATSWLISVKSLQILCRC